MGYWPGSVIQRLRLTSNMKSSSVAWAMVSEAPPNNNDAHLQNRSKTTMDQHEDILGGARAGVEKAHCEIPNEWPNAAPTQTCQYALRFQAFDTQCTTIWGVHLACDPEQNMLRLKSRRAHPGWNPPL